jgi:poly(A) polymerase
MSESKRQFAIEVVRRLQEAGHQALWAGGCVRDLVMGNEPDDFDVATSARPEQVEQLFRRTLAVGASFGVIIVVGQKEQGQVEVATFRTEGPYSDGRHPDQVAFSTPEADAQRRDFTINGLFFDPIRNELLDFVGGRADIERRVLRAIGDPRDRFAEDRLRMLRAVRFSARFDFALDPATEDAIRRVARSINGVSAERIAQELRKLIEDPSRVAGIALCDRVSLLSAVLPDVVALHAVPQGKPMQPTGDLWDHTLFVLEKLGDAWRATAAALSLSGAAPEPSFTLALGALLHDVGKPQTMSRDGDRLTFYHHEHIGSRIAGQIGRRLRLSNDERERIEWLVEYHMYLSDAKHMRLAKLKRILVHPGISELLALHRADALASTGTAEHVDYCEHLLRELPQTELNPPPLVTGHDLVRLDLEPGPQFKGILDKVREAQLDGTVRSKKDAIALAKQLLNQS